MAEELDQLREQIARAMHDAATGRITPNEADLTPYGRMAAAVVDSVMLPLMEQVSRVAYLEAQVGELHQKMGDAWALAEKRLVAREDWKSHVRSHCGACGRAYDDEIHDKPFGPPPVAPGPDAPCACPPNEAVFPGKWTPPQCTVHPDGA